MARPPTGPGGPDHDPAATPSLPGFSQGQEDAKPDVGPPPIVVASGEAGSVALQAVDRLIFAASMDQLPDLLRARAEIIRQDKAVKDDAIDRQQMLDDVREVRKRERLSFWARVAFSIATLGAGTGLTLAGSDAVGCFLLGGSMSIFVPGYVRAYMNRGRSCDESSK